MKIKRLLGFCECPGCMKHAKKELTIMRKTDKVKINVKVCDECSWLLWEKDGK